LRGGYRWGFNGQEKEIGLEEYYSFKYRIHDARLSRFLSIDPLASMYSYNSPYAFAENRVIDGIELEGLEWKKATDNNGNITETKYEGNDANGKPKEGTSSHVAWRQSVTEITVTFEQSTGQTSTKGESNLYLRVGHPDGTVNDYKANETDRVQLPKIPEAYNTYNQNGKDNWGIVSGIAAIINASVDFGKLYQGEKIAWGDLNSSTGKKIPLGKGESHHGGSLQADVRLLSTKGGSVQGKYNQMSFDPIRTKDYFDIMFNNGFSEVLLHESPAGKVQESSIKVTSRPDDHENHYHFQGFRGRR
jgi:RHS repeat-associated protein